MTILSAAPVRGEAPARAEFRTVPAGLAPLFRAALANHRRATKVLANAAPDARAAALVDARSAEAILSRVAQSASGLDPTDMARRPAAIACDGVIVVVPDCEMEEFERAIVIENADVSAVEPRTRRVAAMRPARG